MDKAIAVIIGIAVFGFLTWQVVGLVKDIIEKRKNIKIKAQNKAKEDINLDDSKN